VAALAVQRRTREGPRGREQQLHRMCTERELHLIQQRQMRSACAGHASPAGPGPPMTNDLPLLVKIEASIAPVQLPQWMSAARNETDCDGVDVALRLVQRQQGTLLAPPNARSESAVADRESPARTKRCARVASFPSHGREFRVPRRPATRRAISFKTCHVRPCVLPPTRCSPWVARSC
jgi:hypothetical protein